MNEGYLDFLRFSIDKTKAVPESVENIDWSGLFDFAYKQTLLGIIFDGIQRLDWKWNAEEKMLLVKWFAYAEHIRKRNEIVNKQCVELTERLEKGGFKSCILKGQGNAMMYPNPYARTSGDIDVWLDGKREDIYNYVRSIVPKSFNQNKHIDFPVFKDTVVEVHYEPTTFSNPFYQRRLKRYIDTIREAQFGNLVDLPGYGSISVPTDDFNRIFQLCHIKSHFFVEGIGLRQLIDYYFLLKRSECPLDEVKTLKHLGLLKFAAGVMWIEKHVLGLEDRYLMVEPDGRIGRLILNDVIAAGNFGHHDERYMHKRRNLLMRGLADSWRLLTLITAFPADVICKLGQKIYNQRWKVIRD